MLKREEIVAKYRNRIRQGSHSKLTRDEQDLLIRAFIGDLRRLKSELEIKARCQEEISLLEEGYPQETVAKTRLNRYRQAIQEAVERGKLKLTQKNSKRYEYEKKQGTEKTGEIGQAHHHFAWLYMAYDNDTYLSFTQKYSDA
jgi:hypothetical protein